MDVVLMIVYAVIVLGFLVFIHEGGHFLAARAFGVRVTEFMIGLPGPNIGFTKGETKFGVTPFLLGGYAKVCGMEAGEMSRHIQPVLAAIYRRGTATMEEVASDCHISDEDAYEALEELVEWGSIKGPRKRDQYNTYRTPVFKPTRTQIARAQKKALPQPRAFALGEARPVEDEQALFQHEFCQQYRALPFWKRSVILVAGVAVNLLFAVFIFVIVYSLIGYDVQNTQTGAIQHMVAAPLQAIRAGFMYIGMVIQAVLSLFNPATAAETVQGSTSIMGIAVMSKGAADQGLVSFLVFMAMISVSLGIMNLLPIPPLDGGRFIVELFQKISRRVVSTKVLNYISAAGMILFIGFFLIMVNQDVQRFIFGNWS